ncbi:Dolichol-phosphate mannosyltransferase subunit 3 [Mycena chlorophos]|uniref:Dolichol-phosphate mannosyltransferase subunit 3 n=1 Tax=Mycena chlorophos TaxID=658473 RepID=A0A8H6T5J7_MYCCL|nr:Dolichol-phosphate mannosyltransferase subunit 3 [Mycena chlorophos]
MSRATRVAIVSTLFASIWALVFFQFFAVPGVNKAVVEDIWPLIPWWLLVSFGSYSLGSLGWGLFTFRDCPEAYEELLKEISLAKDDLRSKGVSVD